MTAVARSLIQTTLPWEYLTRAWALLPWSGQPMTPHYCNWQPRVGGRSYIPFKRYMRRQHCAPSSRHDVPRRDGHHIILAVAACTGLNEATSNTPPLRHHTNSSDSAQYALHFCTSSQCGTHAPRHYPIISPGPLCNARAKGSGSRRPVPPIIAAREAQQINH